MKITRIPFELTLQEDKSRSGGLHLTDITRDIALITGVLDKKYEGPIEGEEGIARVELGNAWEPYIIKRHPLVCYHPGELTKDGIAMSPDGISHAWVEFTGLKSKLPVIHELKTTKQSMRREADMTGEWLRLAQTMSYCHAYETNLAIWHLLWLCGDYRDIGMAYRLYSLEFTARELKENWHAIKNHAPVYLKKLEARR